MYYQEELECMPVEQRKQLQSDRLVKLVEKMYNNVPTYRKKMDEVGLKPSDIKGIDDITKLPFTTKQDLREGYPFGMFCAPKREIARVHASSGTTGKLTVVGYTKYDLDVWSDMCARSLVMAGATQDDIVQVSYGYGLFTGGLGLHDGSQRLGSMTVPTSSGNTNRQLMLAKDFGSTVICCTPSYALYLSENLDKTDNDVKLKDLKLRIGIFGAEPWSNEMREEIERRLNIKAFDIYGLSEIMGPGVACECVEHDGLHIEEDHFYPEIIDPDTLEPLADGEYGELVITTLTKEGIPLIRYRTRDITCLIREACPCGRTTVRMHRIGGRSDDMLIIRGVNVFPSQIESVLLSLGDKVLPYYQIIVDRVDALDTFEIQVEMSEKMFSDEVGKIEALHREIEREMANNLQISPKITLVSPNSLARSEGKAKRIIDKRNLGKI